MTSPAFDVFADDTSSEPTPQPVGYLIAFGKKPKVGFLEFFCNAVAQDGVEIKGAILTDGPGCANLAFLLPEPNENFVNQLTMALMPAKWETCTDPRLKVGEFVDDVTRD